MSTEYSYGTNEGESPQVQLLWKEWNDKHGGVLSTAAFEALDKKQACEAVAIMFGTFLTSVHKIDLTANGLKIE